MKTARARTANRGRGRRIIAPGCRVAFPRRWARDQAEHSVRRRWRRPGPSPAMSVRPGRHPVSIFVGSAVAGPWPKWSREGDLQDLSGWTHCGVATSGLARVRRDRRGRLAIHCRRAGSSVAEQWTLNPRVEGSNPSRLTITWRSRPFPRGRPSSSTDLARPRSPAPAFAVPGEAVLAFQAAFRRIGDDVGYAATFDLRR